TRRHALGQVLTGCDRASHLVEQLLTLARLDPQSAAARHAAVDLRSAAAQVVADIAPAALAKDIDLSLADGPVVAVKGDAVMLAVLLRNLVDNAVRYTQRGGEVGVAIEAQGSQARIVVTDNGPGLAPDERAKVGQRFYRVLGSEESGSGLGLSIVRRICDLHGAVLTLDPVPAGSGLRATVVLPRLSDDSL
ncbi:MAG: integral rane sensor signal transduction histidine kinase, partial [Proteobacteria bacterium]|nr:integral rane sensor signal transduction histidine kinase [Pseudomonadota bacterium]